MSADLRLARAFVRSMAAGHGDYGVEVNLDKSKVNFDVEVSVALSRNNRHLTEPAPTSDRPLPLVRVRRLKGDEISWCGLLLDARSLQVRQDYSRYLASSLRDAVTISFDTTPGQRLRDASIRSVKSKLLPILLDSSVNSSHRVRYNIYQAVVFGALVMGAHANGLSRLHKHSHCIFTSTALAVTAALFPHIKALEKNKRLSAGGASIRISKHEVEWVATHAFLAVLQGPSYRQLRRAQLAAAVEHACAHLQEALVRLEGQARMPAAMLAFLSQVARVAYTPQLRSLRC